MPLVWDLQSLHGLMQNRVDLLEELFDTDDCAYFFSLKEKINNHLKSYSVCNISTKNYSLEDLVSKQLLDEYAFEKMICIKKILKEQQIDLDVKSFYETKYNEIRSILKLSLNKINIESKPNRLMFNIFGSKNSRISIRKNSFNIYNLAKDKRNILTPPEGFMFAQFDYKSFQPRLALSLFGDETIKTELRQNEDIYALFEGDREEIKLELISWMFSNRKNDKFDTKLSSLKESRTKLFKQIQNNKLLNSYGRPLFFSNEEENVMFQNYICSTEADCIMSLINHIQTKTNDLKSYLILPFYDCLIYCISDEEYAIINELKKHMENYLYEHFEMNFPVSVKVGKDLLNLRNHDDK